MFVLCCRPLFAIEAEAASAQDEINSNHGVR